MIYVIFMIFSLLQLRRLHFVSPAVNRVSSLRDFAFFVKILCVPLRLNFFIAEKNPVNPKNLEKIVVQTKYSIVNCVNTKKCIFVKNINLDSIYVAREIR